MILLSHPAANSNVRHVALALNRAGVLGEFWTCLDERRSKVLLCIPPDLLAPESGGNPAANGAASRESAFPFVEISRPPAKARVRPINGQLGSDAACRSLDRKISNRLECERFRGVYAYEGGADDSFRAAGLRGLLRIYDLPVGHWRAANAILEEEAVLEPEWAATLGRNHACPRRTARKDSELQQADLVFVTSTFSMRTLEKTGAPPGAIAVVPHGTAAMPVAAAPSPPRAANGKLRALFVGDLSQRKGLSYLFRACRELRSEVSLTVVGPRPSVSCRALERELLDVSWRPYGSPAQLSAEMAAHDVFVFPSLFEGRGDVLLEAMAMGLPIIATPHTAAPDVIDDGVEGFVVPVRSSDTIVEKLELLRREPDLRAHMAANARCRALAHTWERYERTIASSVAAALERRG